MNASTSFTAAREASRGPGASNAGMASQTITRVEKSDLEPGKIYAVLAEASNLRRWAPGFADAVERIDGADVHYRVTKGGETFAVEVALHHAAGTVDFIREMADGSRGGAYMRVMPRPLGGSAITITVPVRANANPSDVAAVLEQELAAVLRLASA